jgi:exonuclease III
MQELAEELAKTRLEVVAIQEIRWSGKGVIKKKDFSLYYSGTKEQLGQAGTGFILKGRITNNVIGFEAINERLCRIRIKGKYNNVTLVNMYAPTEDKTDPEKEKFYEELQLVIDQTPKSDTILVLGDANAKLGKEDIYKEVSGKHTLHELSNRNGEMLLEFATGNNLTVMSTQFQHKRIHKGNWLAPDQTTLNQIDHVLISSKKKDLTEDVRSMRGPNIDSDHYLLKIIISQNLPKN